MRSYAVLIVFQLLFAYLFEMLLSWSRRKVWHLGFGPFPVVLSINLFMWFKPDFFIFQFLLLALTYLGKEFVTWKRNGKSTHIINPSAFSLSLLSVGLLATDSVDKTFGLDLIWSFYLPANFYEVIFLLGLVVQFLFSTTLVTFGAVLGLYGMVVVSGLIYGSSVVITPFDASVFLGLTLLITDPSTTPRTKFGKFSFGLAYGCVILCTFFVLRYLRQPSYFDKILAVPLMNLLVMPFDSLGVRVQGWISKSWRPVARYVWAVSMCGYAVLIFSILPSLKMPNPDFVDPLPHAAIRVSFPMSELRAKYIALHRQYPELDQPFSFKSEWAHLRNAYKFEPVTAEEYNNLGMAYLDLSQSGQALSYFEQAVDIDPSHGPSQCSLGNQRFQQGDIEAAIVHLRKAIQIDEKDATAHRILGTALSVQGDYIEGVKHLEQALQFNAADDDGHLILGTLLAAHGKLDQAIIHFRHAVEINPNLGGAHYNLGKALVSEGKIDDGVRHLYKAQKLLPGDPEVSKELQNVRLVKSRQRF
ncbi:MAG: tetratricopeptide repeat protein [Fuerstiella sp.]|nr:tetratricopeptide repeat protein [Fuerstiella sp.]